MSKAKIFLASVVWLLLLTIGVLLYRFWIVPQKEKAEAEAVAKQEQVEQQVEQQIVEATSGSSRYRLTINLGLDAFSGYAILRSDEFNQQLRNAGIKLNLKDDGADYQQRLGDLADGSLQMAAFPIDALLKSSETKGSLPATIVAIIDETRGADALLAYKNKYPDIDSLNSPQTRFVLVGNSPSETLVRVLMHDFQLDQVSSKSLVTVDNEKQVLERYQASIPAGDDVFVTWEPLVSELKENDQLHVLIDTAGQSGYIVDALVVSRDFLIKYESEVKTVLECYFRALYEFRETSKLQALVKRDAAAAGSTISDEQVASLVGGIVWKNTQENFAHFGLLPANLTYVEDMIDRVKRVLVDTGGLSKDPTDGNSRLLFYEKSLAELQAANFHPGVSQESIRDDVRLVKLNEQQWQSLVPVGTLSVPPLVFPRGTSIITERSESILEELVEKLKSWPQYYLMIRGNAGSRGNMEANQLLAKQRAEAALQYLQSKGVAADRVRAVEGEITGSMSVTFVLGQPPY